MGWWPHPHPDVRRHDRDRTHSSWSSKCSSARSVIRTFRPSGSSNSSTLSMLTARTDNMTSFWPQRSVAPSARRCGGLRAGRMTAVSPATMPALAHNSMRAWQRGTRLLKHAREVLPPGHIGRVRARRRLAGQQVAVWRSRHCLHTRVTRSARGVDAVQVRRSLKPHPFVGRKRCAIELLPRVGVVGQFALITARFAVHCCLIWFGISRCRRCRGRRRWDRNRR